MRKDAFLLDRVGRCRVTGKVQYRTREVAKRDARSMSKPRPGPYYCDACGWWHLGGLYGKTRATHRTIRGRSKEKVG